MTAHFGSTSRTYMNTQVTTREAHYSFKHFPSRSVMLQLISLIQTLNAEVCQSPPLGIPKQRRAPCHPRIHAAHPFNQLEFVPYLLNIEIYFPFPGIYNPTLWANALISSHKSVQVWCRKGWPQAQADNNSNESDNTCKEHFPNLFPL